MSPAPRCNIRVSAPGINESDDEADECHVDNGEAALSRRKVKLMAQHAVKSAVKRAASAPRLDGAGGRGPPRSAGARGAHGRNAVSFARTPHAAPRPAF